MHHCTHTHTHAPAHFRKIELYIDTQRDIQDYIWCIIGRDQPSNWEVNALLSDAPLSISKLRNHQQTPFISPIKCANFDQGHFSFYTHSAVRLRRISSPEHMNAGISGGVFVLYPSHSQPSERLRGNATVLVLQSVCNTWRCTEPICGRG